MMLSLLTKVENYLAIILVYALVILLALQVFFRYLVNFPQGWTEEIARFVFIWMIFVGAVLATRGNEHVRVELIKQYIPAGWWIGLNVLTDLCILVFWAFLIPAAFKYAFYAVNIDASGSGIPMIVVFISLPLCGLLVVIRTLGNMTRKLTN